MNPFVYFVDWVKAGAISLGVTTTAIFQPYHQLTRDVSISDPRSLSEKAQLFDADILTNDITSEQVYLYERPVNLGDMCIWNGVHVAYRAIRYGQTHDPNDLAQLKKSMLSLEAMQTHPVTHQTILLRGRCPKAEYDGSHGGYRQVHETDDLIWQEDASGDSFAGHVYGLAMAWKYGDQEVKDFVGILSRELYLWMKANNYNLVNADGTRTKFSANGPGVTSSPMTITTYLLLTKILELQYPNDLEVGHEYHRWAVTWNQIHQASHSMPAFLWVKIYPGVNQAKMSLHGLLELETNSRYRSHYITAIKRGWWYMKEDGDSYFTFLAAHFVPDIVNARQLGWGTKVLEEFSVENKINGRNVDLTSDKTIDHVRWGGPMAVQPYPAWQQGTKDYYWQRDPHKLIEGDTKQFNGLDFLIAYYTGKLYNFID